MKRKELYKWPYFRLSGRQEPLTSIADQGHFSRWDRWHVNTTWLINKNLTMILLHKVNQLTHWIDASNVYGSAVEETNRLRRFKDGLLRVHVNPDGSELLPDSGDPECRGRYDHQPHRQCASFMFDLSPWHIDMTGLHDQEARTLSGAPHYINCEKKKTKKML